ncbi:lasso peptide biosynthesis B2 protein [Cellulosilyticum ruminicola]|uniref:lasso peptide biosynthesis B2 protein n=1 Tax=Cellulosilyticum ruminicola TaxID=425254 RepID=UPI0006CFF7AF|nr:lasso peptide biosynthesis B2 protein [Cellulosilyticum ruminicola]
MIHRLFRKLKVWTRIPFKDKVLLGSAYILSGIARFLMLAVPLKKFQPCIGVPNEESPYESVSSEDLKIIKRVHYYSLLACRYTPWESKCLVRALVVSWLLRYYKIPTTLYFGVAKGKSLLAHAWLRCGTYIITGGDVQKDFVEVAHFSNYSWVTHQERSCEKNV